jgi:hypothetical protein
MPLNCALGSVLGAKLSKTTHRSITWEGEGVDYNAFSISIYCFTWSRRLLQHQPSSPSSTSILVAFNFNPHRQLHPSSPSTSTLIAFQFPNRVAFLFPPLILDGHGVLDAAVAR